MDSKPCNPKDAIALDKLPLHLVSPVIKAYQAISHFLGNVKYGAHNYRVAPSRASVYFSALGRHMDAWWEGERYDPVDGTPHLANAQACLNILIEAEHGGLLIDDRPPSRAAVLRELRAEFEALMPKIRERYKDKNPRHYTIADTAEAPAPDALPGLTVTESEPLPMIERRAPRPVDARAMVEAAHMMGRMAAGDDVSSDDVAAMATRLLDQAGAA